MNFRSYTQSILCLCTDFAKWYRICSPYGIVMHARSWHCFSSSQARNHKSVQDRYCSRSGSRRNWESWCCPGYFPWSKRRLKSRKEREKGFSKILFGKLPLHYRKIDEVTTPQKQWTQIFQSRTRVLCTSFTKTWRPPGDGRLLLSVAAAANSRDLFPMKLELKT